MAATAKQLGQTRPAGTSAVSIYSPGASTNTAIRQIVVCNTDTSDRTFSIYHDADGTTYDDTTVLWKDQAIQAGETIQIDCWLAANDSSGNVAVKSSVADKIVFSVYGLEVA